MRLKERKEKVNTYIHIGEKLETRTKELEEIEGKLEIKRQELQEIDTELLKKKSLLEQLKIEAVELKYFINAKFKEEFTEYDYMVDITDCYIIGINGKKYIALKKRSTDRSNWYTKATGCYNVEIYDYYDVLTVNDKKYKHIHRYKYGHFDYPGYFSPKVSGKKPDYEERLLLVYPELSNFVDNKVPNTYLQKIYYEINELGNKKLNKEYFK